MQLFVGPLRGMFPTVEDAVDMAIPGDIIEICTNMPMVVGGSIMRHKVGSKNLPLVIRAGPRYQPVLRGVGGLPFLTVVNVDLIVVGLHFSAVVGTIFVDAENSNVVMERCSLTLIKRTAEMIGSLLSIKNTNEKGSAFSVQLNHCFVRTCLGGIHVVTMSGPSISAIINESAFSGAIGIWCVPADNQNIFVRQCRLHDSELIYLPLVGKKLTIPLSFQMDRCISTTILERGIAVCIRRYPF